MELLTLRREYKPDEIDDLDRCCKKMYHLLVTTIGGLEAITNYFHLIGSGHVVWMVRRYGNMWRFRNEGVEAFNAIVSLRHNKNNKKGGYKKTRKKRRSYPQVCRILFTRSMAMTMVTVALGLC